VVERTFRVTRCRRLACDYEHSVAHSEAMVTWGHDRIHDKSAYAHPQMPALAADMTLSYTF